MFDAAKIDKFKNAKDIFDLSEIKFPPPINLHGEKGIKCLNCGGWGFTIWLDSKKAKPCDRCNYTGVEPEPGKTKK